MTETTTIVPDAPPEERKPNRKRRGSLFIKDTELVELIGGDPKVVRHLLHDLDKQHLSTGFPQKIKRWGDRRYWPAVKAYFDYLYGFKVRISPQERQHHVR